MPELLVDLGEADPSSNRSSSRSCSSSLRRRRHPADAAACQPGYDHSYYFISTFMADHLRWHAERLA